MYRPWAFWRRLQYGTVFSVFIALFLYWGYASFFYIAPTCFDGRQNGEERGVDCGGGCLRICAMDTERPTVTWARSFRVTDGQYNAVAYVENPNQIAGAPLVRYTFSLYDREGLITERVGTTFLPPNNVYPIFEGRITTGNRIPVNTFLELEPIDVWLPVTAGREQFRVVSRELLASDTRPRLNAQIENTALTTVNDVTVVATIFDARGNALTSSQTVVNELAARSTEPVVFTWPEPIAKTVRSCEVPTDVVIAIDLSGSMNNDGGTPPQPVSDVLTAASDFAERLRPGDQAALVTFATEAATVEPLGMPSRVANSISRLTIDSEEETGSTNTGAAFVRAQELFASTAKNENARKVMVVLTDGLATAPEEDPEQFALTQAQALKDTGVEVYAIGLGQQVNMNFVRSLATDQNAYQAITRAQINQIYQQITGAICEDGAAVIDIVPMTDTNFPALRN